MAHFAFCSTYSITISFSFFHHLVIPNLSLVLNVIALIREVNALKKKIEMPASNSTQSTTDITGECCFTTLFYICWQSLDFAA